MTRRMFDKINESNVDKHIDDLINRTKGDYIMQGVAFNKTCKRQLALLKWALLESSSFSGLIKELIALRVERDDKKIIHGYAYESDVKMEKNIDLKVVNATNSDSNKYANFDNEHHIEKVMEDDEEDTFLLL